MKDELGDGAQLPRGAAYFRIVRFIGVGGISAIVYWIVMLAGVTLARLVPIFASIVAYSAGFLTAYYGHRRFTYRSDASINAELPRFLVVHLLCFTIGNLAFWYVEARLGASLFLAGAALTATSFSISYAASELWVFRKARRRRNHHR